MDQAQAPVVETYGSRAGAEVAVTRASAGGMETTCLSIGVRGSELERHAAGFDAVGGVEFLGGHGAIWGALWGPDLESAVFLLPTTEPLVVTGPRAGWIACAINGSAIGGTSGVIAVALVSVGIPDASVATYEAEMKAGRFLVVAHASPRADRTRIRRAMHSALMARSGHTVVPEASERPDSSPASPGPAALMLA